MRKIIALSTFLAVAALGMACGDSAANNSAMNANKNGAVMMNANANTVVSTTTNTQVNGATGATNTTTTTNTMNSNMKPMANGNMMVNANKK
ncbi:MAG: hypothetical protein ABIO91_06230 [Pyrinomonadaceae bacterium]